MKKLDWGDMKKVWKMERYRDASIQKKLTLSTWLVAIIPIMIILPRYYKYEKAWEKEVISYL